MKIYQNIILKFFLLFIWISVWVFSVFGTDLFFDAKIKWVSFFSKNIFLWDKNLNYSYIIYNSLDDLSDAKLVSICKTKSKFIWKKENNYSFQITFLDKCDNGIVYLVKNWKQVKNSIEKFNIFDKSKLFDIFVDYSSLELQKFKDILEKKLQNIKSTRKRQEIQYQISFLQELLNHRQEKYLTPVKWYKISNKLNKIPNAWRPYRQSYTDWIHHGWDIMAPYWTKVRAIDDWKIIRIVRNFQFSDLWKIKKTQNLTKKDKLINLDILRWNQVWLKTYSWDVVFYSHLSKIADLKVWDMVKKWQYLGNIWKSWVPDRNYKEIHLHFAIMKNPYNINHKKYSYLDYMSWNWYFKGKSAKYILDNTNKIFTNNL